MAIFPGREGRLLETPMVDLHAMAAAAATELRSATNRRVALAGISFGALVAFEVACLLADGGAPPAALFVASQRAPRCPRELHGWHELDSQELVAKLVQIGGLDTRDACDLEFQELFLGAIRADLRASETYSAPARAPLNCPIFVYRGQLDPVVSEEDCRSWQAETSSTAVIHTLGSGHFLLNEAEDQWLAALRADLLRVCASNRSLA